MREEKRRCKEAELASTLGLTLHTDPAHPTRVGNSVTRDTCPALPSPKTLDTQNGPTPRKPSAVTTAYSTPPSEPNHWQDPTPKPAYPTGQSSGKTTPIRPLSANKVTTRGHKNWLHTFVGRKLNYRRPRRRWTTTSCTSGRRGTASSADGAAKNTIGSLKLASPSSPNERQSTRPSSRTRIGWTDATRPLDKCLAGALGVSFAP